MFSLRVFTIKDSVHHPLNGKGHVWWPTTSLAATSTDTFFFFSREGFI